MTLIPFASRPSPLTVDEKLDRLTSTVESHGASLRRIEAGLRVLLDDAAALRARVDAALPEAGAR
jgi:hypothetical protein